MRALRSLAPLVCALLVAGCGGEGDEPTGPESDGPLVEYVRSGGFAYSLSEAVVEPDGTATFGAGTRPDDLQERQVTLSAEELASLEDAVAAAEIEEFEPGDGVCADCYEYEVTTAAGTAEFSDVDLDEEFGGTVPPGLRDLLAELARLTERYAPATPEPLGGA